jgi:hypothetical protein
MWVASALRLLAFFFFETGNGPGLYIKVMHIAFFIKNYYKVFITAHGLAKVNT